ncbi:MAG: chemotaxis response regulator protein-glutamate methylesterase [Clostridiales Family XIII bacterium]|jgi:two-component system chemotaxis response regulator CheB|nr:chemotaxis response regulator protein-glutamate methylesterase [Clostridiales Family XIII bacterium]
MSDKIKLMVLDDSLLFREVMIQGFQNDDRIEIVGFASDPFDATEKIPLLEPDVLTCDIEMPRMDGIKFIRCLMSQYPLPVIVVSSLAVGVFESMDAGALDFINKPENLNDDTTKFFEDLRGKIIAASQAKFAFRRRENIGIHIEPAGVRGAVNSKNIIAIGASTGGTDAINSVLTKFSPNMPGIVVVQHMPAGFTKLYAQRLDEISNLSVKEAEDGDEVMPGRALIAAGDFHMRVEKSASGCVVRIEKAPKVNGHRPSVDVLFESVAETCGREAIGVILTGMGADGAEGLKKIRDFGGYTIGQDERSSVVYGMPMAAYLLGAVMVQLPLYRVPDEIIRKLNTGL